MQKSNRFKEQRKGILRDNHILSDMASWMDAAMVYQDRKYGKGPLEEGWVLNTFPCKCSHLIIRIILLIICSAVNLYQPLCVTPENRFHTFQWVVVHLCVFYSCGNRSLRALTQCHSFWRNILSYPLYWNKFSLTTPSSRTLF